MKKCALFISPHLDDVVFSCGGTLAKMADENWTTILCTAFTKSVSDPKGFALGCQLDKNLAPDVDYMKLRRREDFRAAAVLGAAEVLHLNFPEAPHRGYESAAELFAGVKSDDEIWRPLVEHFALLDEIHQPQIVFAPQGLGGHADHLQVIRSALGAFAPKKIVWYQDTPYVIRQPDAASGALMSFKLALENRICDITEYIVKKIAACRAYATQIDFQFGGEKQLESLLTDFHRLNFDAGVSSQRSCEKFLCRPENIFR